MRTLLWFLLLAAPLYGQPVITAPPGPVPVGGFLDVLVEGLSNSSTLAWEVIPAAPVRVYSNWGTTDPILALPSNQEGTWNLVIMAVEDGKVFHETVQLVVGKPIPPGPGPGPEPGPGPQPPPDDPTEFSKKVEAALALVDQEARAKHSEAIAGAFTGVAGDSTLSVEQMSDRVKTRVTSIFSGDLAGYQAWQPFWAPISKALTEEEVSTKEELVERFQTIASVLQEK